MAVSLGVLFVDALVTRALLFLVKIRARDSLKPPYLKMILDTISAYKMHLHSQPIVLKPTWRTRLLTSYTPDNQKKLNMNNNTILRGI